jgi:two-component system sensor kinase FixL
MKILVVDQKNVASEIIKKLNKTHFVVSDLDDLAQVEMIFVISVEENDAGRLAALLEQRSDFLRLAHFSMIEEAAIWKTIENFIDDLFSDEEVLLSRLPFIHRRLIMRESRRRQFSAVFESTVEGIIIINARGIIQLFNRAAEQIFQYSASEVIGQNISMLMPDKYSRNHDRYIDNYVSTGKKKIIGIGREVAGLRRSGEEFPMDLAVSEFESYGQRLFAGTVRDISERRRLEHEILRISEQERRRVGQDLHDGLGQMLTGISLIGRNLAKRMEAENSDLAEDMHEITELVRDADRLTRSIARGLVQVELEGDGMSAALRSLCENAEKYFSIACTYQESGNVKMTDTSAASNLFRIAQEAVSNAVKHGRAENVTVSLRGTPEGLILCVEDDGIGFPEVLKADRGMGVDIMGYRARVINAILEIEAEKGKGTIVRCTLSLPVN